MTLFSIQEFKTTSCAGLSGKKTDTKLHKHNEISNALEKLSKIYVFISKMY